MLLDPNLAEIVGVTETWLKPEDDNCMFLCKDTHDIFRFDRVHGIHGGVALLICKKCKCSQVTFDIVHDLEYVCVRMITRGHPLYIAICYKPSVNDSHLLGDLENSIECLDRTKFPYILMGDFNLPDIDWCIPTCKNNRGPVPVSFFIV